MQSIVAKGKDINNAINLGLELLDATKQEVNIEIIQQETKGFLGIRSRGAIVKLTKIKTSSPPIKNEKKPSDAFELAEQFVSTIFDEEVDQLTTISKEDQEENTKQEAESLAGKVWVKNGQLHCQSSPTKFPLVTISENIDVLKNNQLLKEKTTTVSEKDFFVLKVTNEEIETTWKVSMDQHKLKVLLHVDPGYRIVRTIADMEPDHHIKLMVEEKKEFHNTLTYGDIIEKLESLRVKHGFNQDEILKATETVEAGSFEIATGIKAKPGKDGWVEIKVDLETKEGPKESEDGRVDYREREAIPTIEKGEIIAIVHPPIPGEMGYTVTNEPLPPKEAKPVILKKGKGIMTVDEKIVATESGRPTVEKRGQLVKVAIMSKLTLPGDIDLISGNIHFMGDVEILGKVEESMTVETEGDILVHKTVNMASLTASGAIITYGTVIGSKISAGKNNMLVAELGPLLENLHQNLEKMIVIINQLTQSSVFKDNDFARGGLQPLIRILLEKKFKSFPTLVKKYVNDVKKGQNYLQDDEWKEISIALTQLFLVLTKEVTSLDQLVQLSQKMKERYEVSKIPVEPNSFIRVPNALNSHLYCSGDVMITGQGCVNTKIHAGGSLKVIGSIRGGEVYGRLGIEINEVGAEMGTSTVLTVPRDQKININKAMEGTSIKIGNVKHIFKETRYLVRARLDEKERMIFD